MKLRLPSKLVAAIMAAASPVLLQTLSTAALGAAATAIVAGGQAEAAGWAYNSENNTTTYTDEEGHATTYAGRVYTWMGKNGDFHGSVEGAWQFVSDDQGTIEKSTVWNQWQNNYSNGYGFLAHGGSDGNSNLVSTLRFTSGTVTPPSAFSFTPLNIAGIIVESGAEGYSVQSSGDRKIVMGNTDVEAYSSFAEDFALNSGTANLVLRGTQTLDVASTKTLTLTGVLSLESTANVTIGGAGKTVFTGGITNNGSLTLNGQTEGDITNAGSLTLNGATTGYIKNTSGNSTITVTGTGETQVKGFCLSSNQNSKTVVTIESGATLHVTGTTQSTTGNTGSFMLSNWPGTSTMYIYGVVVSEAAFSGRDGSGEMYVKNGGVLEMRKGISMLAQRNTNKLTVEAGGTLRAGNTTGSTGNYTLTLQDGATLEGYYTPESGETAESNEVTIGQNMELGSAEQSTTIQGVNFSAASGKTMTLSGVLSGSGTLKVSGGGIVKLTNGGNSVGDATVSADSKLELGNSAKLTLSTELNGGSKNLSNIIGAGTIALTEQHGIVSSPGCYTKVTLDSDFTGTLHYQGGLQYDSVLGGATKVVFGGTSNICFNSSANETHTFGKNIELDANTTLGLSIWGNATTTSNNILSGTIKGAAGTTIKKVDGGVLTLSAANTEFLGAISVEGGTLKVGNNQALGSMNASRGAITIGSGAKLDVNGYEGTGSGYSVTLNGGTLTNSGDARGATKRQVVTTLTLTADSTVDAAKEFGMIAYYYGATAMHLNEYTLNKTGNATYHITNTAIDGTGTLKVSAGTLEFHDNDDSNQGSLNSNLEMNGGSISGIVHMAGNVKITATAANSTFSAQLTTGSHTLTEDGSGNLNMSGDISGEGSLVKNGTGTLNLSGALSFAGTTTINGGTLILGRGGNKNVQNLGEIVMTDGTTLKSSGSAESMVRNIKSLSVNGSATLREESWNTFWNIEALNKGTAEDNRTLTWNMTTSHWSNSVLSLTGEGDFDGTLHANRTHNPTSNGYYQAYVEISHQDALKDAVLNATGSSNNEGTESSYMTVALHADKVNISGLQGNAQSILMAGEANKATGSGSNQQGNIIPVSSGTSELVINSKDGAEDAFAGKVLGGISITKKGSGTQSFSGNMESFDGSISATAGVLQLLNQTSVSVQDLLIAGADAEHQAVVGVYTGADNTTSEGGIVVNGTLTGNSHATLNANLTMSDGSTIDVSGENGLHMGSALTFANGGKMILSDGILGSLADLGRGEGLTLFSGVDSFTLGGSTYSDAVTYNAQDYFNLTSLANPDNFVIRFQSDAAADGGTVSIFAVPEPTTATLSLLALAALAARRRRK